MFSRCNTTLSHSIVAAMHIGSTVAQGAAHTRLRLHVYEKRANASFGISEISQSGAGKNSTKQQRAVTSKRWSI